MFNPIYNEAVIKTRIINIDGAIVPELPVASGMTLVFADGINYNPGDLPERLVGKDCLALIVFKKDLSNIVEATQGYLGMGNAVCNTSEYQSIVGSTEPVWVNLTTEYEDK